MHNMVTKDAAVVRNAAVLEESCTASTNNSKHATQNIAPAANPRPTYFFFPKYYGGKRIQSGGGGGGEVVGGVVLYSSGYVSFIACVRVGNSERQPVISLVCRGGKGNRVDDTLSLLTTGNIFAREMRQLLAKKKRPPPQGGPLLSFALIGMMEQQGCY